MSKFSLKKEFAPGDFRHVFFCPGCECGHYVRVQGPGPTWEFNGDIEKPTVTPSILVTWDEGEARVKKICHSFVVLGKIRFLDDCTHKLRSQTVDLPEWEP